MPYPKGPNPSQRKFHESVLAFRWTAYFGGHRSGKSRAAMEQVLEFAMKYPGIKIGVFRKYEEDLMDTSVADFETFVPRGMIARQMNKGKTKILKNGSRIMFKGLYTRSGRTQKIGSLEFGACMIDEADECSEHDFLMVKGRLAQSDMDQGARRGWLVSNPPTIAHWLYRQFGPVRPAVHNTIHGKTRDNAENLGEEYLTDLEASYAGTHGAYAKRFLDGEFGISLKGTPVLQGFDPSKHIQVRSVDPSLQLLRGWDFGFHRPAVTFWQFNGVHWHWFDTILGQGVHLRDFIPKVQLLTNQLNSTCHVWDACDVAGHQRRDNADQTSIEILQDYNIFPLSRKTPSTYDGADLMQTALVHGHLSVEPTNTLGVELLAGGWQVESDGEGKDRDRFRILKDGIYDHIGDANRYLFVNWFAMMPDSAEEAPKENTLAWFDQQYDRAEHLQSRIGNEGFSLSECLAALR